MVLFLGEGHFDFAPEQDKVEYYENKAKDATHEWIPPVMLVAPRKKSESDLKDAVSDILSK